MILRAIWRGSDINLALHLYQRSYSDIENHRKYVLIPSCWVEDVYLGRMKYLLTDIVYDGFGSIKGGNPRWSLALQPSAANYLRETMSAKLLKVDLQGRRTQRAKCLSQSTFRC